MPWISVTHSLPPDGELVLLWDSRANTLHTGCLNAGIWHAEGSTAADSITLDHITHWSWLLDSQLNWDPAED